MNVIEFFEQTRSAQSDWTDRIAKGDWRAAPYLAKVLREDSFQHRYGPNGRVLLLTDDDNLVSFCTLVAQDEIVGTSLLPWIGFVYTFPAYRGHRYSEKLIHHACSLAKAGGYSHVYLSSDETGLYEKYGFLLYKYMRTVDGDLTQVFSRRL